MAVIIECADGLHREHAITAAVAAARRGDVLIVPTETVYALATDAFSARGVAAIRTAKGYSAAHPLPVMVGSSSTVSGIAARVSPQAKRLMSSFWPGPATLLLDPQPTLAWDLPAQAPLTVRMPLHPLLIEVLRATGPMVVTAAGIAGLEPPRTAAQALAQAGSAASVVLDAGSLGANVAGETDDAMGAPLPSTVIDARTVPPVIVREGELTHGAMEERCPGLVAPRTAPADA